MRRAAYLTLHPSTAGSSSIRYLKFVENTTDEESFYKKLNYQ